MIESWILYRLFLWSCLTLYNVKIFTDHCISSSSESFIEPNLFQTAQQCGFHSPRGEVTQQMAGRCEAPATKNGNEVSLEGVHRGRRRRFRPQGHCSATTGRSALQDGGHGNTTTNVMNKLRILETEKIGKWVVFFPQDSTIPETAFVALPAVAGLSLWACGCGHGHRGRGTARCPPAWCGLTSRQKARPVKCSRAALPHGVTSRPGQGVPECGGLPLPRDPEWIPEESCTLTAREAAKSLLRAHRGRTILQKCFWILDFVWSLPTQPAPRKVPLPRWPAAISELQRWTPGCCPRPLWVTGQGLWWRRCT